MLSAQENATLTRVGPGTVMGNLLRQYWIPVVYSEEVEPDGPPLRVRLLGEDLIAFRDTAGRPGLVGDHCPHRGASLFFGRNEESGLRCVYHGWKFDVTGACVDMPNEPPESNFKHKIRHTAYPCVEKAGIVWTYMGPRSEAPPLPGLEWMSVPEDHRRHAWKAIRECNWVQAMEGDLDTSHAPFLHSTVENKGVGVAHPDKAPRLEVMETEYGLMYGARRNEGPNHYYWRSTQFLMPFYTLFPALPDGEVPCHMWVPLDDETTLVWLEAWRPLRAFSDEERAGRSPRYPYIEMYWPNNGVGEMLRPKAGRPYDRWWGTAGLANDFMIDREVQRTQTFTGIPTIPLQDGAVTVSMGRISDRTREHLGTADAMIIQARRRLVGAARALRDEGVPPSGVDSPDLYRVRSCSAVLPTDVNWMEAFREWHACRAGLPEERVRDEARQY